MGIYILIILGFAAIGFFLYTIKVNLEQNKLKDDPVQKLMLDMMENLRKEFNDGSSKHRLELQQRMDKITEQLSKHQVSSSETLQKQFAQSASIIKEVTEKLTKLDETNKQVVGFAEQMKSLENILKNPKQRGILGEYLLENLLSNVLSPTQYQMQYKFKNGEIVDAAIFVKDRVIPIDAKFTLENYNKIMQENDKERREIYENDFKKDVRNRIDETSKYIRAEEDTMDFAFMFIPAEGVYYNLLIYNIGIDVNSKNLIEYAFNKKVIIVSPTSFYAYLITVLQGLKALQIEETAKDIMKRVSDLGRHLNSYESCLGDLGRNLGTVVNKYNSAYGEFKKIDKDIYKITDGESGGKAEILNLEKPIVD